MIDFLIIVRGGGGGGGGYFIRFVYVGASFS